eukprot:1881406-Amphidinium_carterae.5
MSQSKSDACVFKNQSEAMFILNYVDDLLFIGKEPEENAFITNISKVLNLKHTTHLPSGTYIHFLGRKIHKGSESVIEISMMESFKKSVYEVYGLQKSNSVSAPGVKSPPALPTSRDEPEIQNCNRNSVGELSAQTSEDESATKQLIKYRRGTQNRAFRIALSTWRASQCIELHAYCDSDRPGCPINSKSTTGVICQLRSASIASYSRTQATVLRVQLRQKSFLESTSAANDLIHLQSVIIEMGIVKSAEGIKLHLHTDSASSKAMVSMLGMSNKSKHIELKYLHLQGLVESGVISAQSWHSKQPPRHSHPAHATIHTQQAFQQGRTGRDSHR